MNNLQIETYESVVQQRDALEKKLADMAAENAGLKQALECVINPDNQPEYHDLGMGCGVEDRGYQSDGYSACAYGWESAMDRVYSEVIPDALPETPVTDAFTHEWMAKGVDMYAELFKDTVSMDIKHNKEFHKGTVWYADQLRKGINDAQ